MRASRFGRSSTLRIRKLPLKRFVATPIDAARRTYLSRHHDQPSGLH